MQLSSFKKVRVYRSAIAVLLFLCGTTSFADDSIYMDRFAQQRVDLLFQKLGGKSTWANAKNLYLAERGRHIQYGDGIVANFWRNLEQPGEKAHYQHTDLNLLMGWNEDKGWQDKNGDLRDYTDTELEKNTFYWRRNIFTLLHQLAQDNPSLKVKFLKPNGLQILDIYRKPLADFHLTGDGELYMWTQYGGRRPQVTLYGPYRSFGAVSFPDWGAASDGRWTSYYVQLMLSDMGFKKKVSLHKPHNDWHGGAVKKDCE